MIRLNLNNNSDVKINLNSTGANHTNHITLTNTTGGGVRDYNRLDNKPAIGGHTLVGNSALSDIGINEITDDEIRQLFR